MRRLHDWTVTPAEARAIQSEIAGQVDTATPLGPVDVIAAADVSFGRFDKELVAGVVVVRADTFEVIERRAIVAPIAFPYVSGLLSFREAPALLEVFEQVRTSFDVVLCDGQGVAHPRRLGIASHLGLWLDKPTIGCAKSRLFGDFEEPGEARGDWSPLTDHGQVIGAVLRTRARTKPLFVSPGHQCDLASAIRVVLAAAPRLRLPTPARLVHLEVNAVRRRVAAGSAQVSQRPETDDLAGSGGMG